MNRLIQSDFSPPAATDAGRANNFDFLRVALATLVIFSHSYQLVSGPEDSDPIARLMHGQMSAGALAVDFFFVLSGFLVVQSWERSRTAMDFVRKRVLRIYPGFAVSLIFCVMIVGPLSGVNVHRYFTSLRTYKFFEMLLLRPELRMPEAFARLPNAEVLNASLWTIRFELMCYMAVLLFGAAGMIRRRGVMVGVLGLLYLLFNLRLTGALNTPFFGALGELPRLLAYFLAGTAFYLFRNSIPHSRVLFGISLVALAATLGGGLSWTLPVFGTYTIFYIAFSRTVRLHHFARWGDFSYGLYLYAYPLQQLMIARMGLATPPLVIFVLSSAGTLVLAVASWYGVERPCLKLKPRARAVVDRSSVSAATAPLVSVTPAP